MSGRHRVIVAGLLLLGILVALVFIAFASAACPVEREGQPCPEAPRNLVIGVALAASSAGLLVTPFAFLGEVLARRRIVYRGAWSRAARRGVLVGLVLAALAGLRLGGALNVPITIFIIVLAAVVEWFAARRDAS
jgi:MFS family permease